MEAIIDFSGGEKDELVSRTVFFRNVVFGYRNVVLDFESDGNPIRRNDYRRIIWRNRILSYGAGDLSVRFSLFSILWRIPETDFPIRLLGCVC